NRESDRADQQGGPEGVMAGLVQVIHVVRRIEPMRASRTGGKLCVYRPLQSTTRCLRRLWSGAAWMAGTSPAMTEGSEAQPKKADQQVAL
ncbi:MAG TPA: hypothetical protein VIZ19_15155, partial [Roseiarcus sp.]